MEVSDGRMMGSMLAVDAGAVFKLALQCLSQERVERLLLTCADVETRYGKGNAQFETV
jgi:hypothetical protein